MSSVKTKKNFTEGPLFFKMLIYTVPIILTSLLQIFYNMADHIVVSQFSGDEVALAAIGSTGSLTTLVTSFLIGIGGGAGVVVAHFIGARRREDVSRASHTSVLFSIISGFLLMLFGLLISEWALSAMGTKDELFDSALLYFRIICIGFPATAVYNFGASVLKAAGDSKMPLYILATAGIVNVVLNIFFVVVCSMTVDGVAIATVISQYLSAVWVLFVLRGRKDEDYAICFKRLRIDKYVLLRILRLGIPTGLQSCLFSFSNVLIASAINQFDTVTITAKTIQGNIDAITSVVISSFSQTVLTFAGQNYGAMKVKRINKVVLYGLAQVVTVGGLVSLLEIIFVEPLCSLFIEAGSANYDLVMSLAAEVSRFMLKTYVLCGIMEALSAAIRGLGYSVSPMIIVLVGACLLRIVWIYTVFPLEEYHSLIGVLTCYPVTWIITSAALAAFLAVVLIKLNKKAKE